jgi:thioredoxin reductase
MGVPGEEKFLGRGVSRCASCDGGFYRGKDVAVIGGGDGAVHEALVLARTSATVHLICRSPIRAKREFADRLDARENVRFHWDSEVAEVLGDTKVSGLRLRDRRTGVESDLACEGVFPFIGVQPNSSFVPAELQEPGGHVTTRDTCRTADPRLFAVGALRADYGGQAVQAMAEGVTAAEAASAYLAKEG